ncbi:dialkylrecorsinol condensing enzyme [Halorhodospira sp. 9622]|uniref:dialkylrecorsinol condensing enzyme n=1 Tax=Halorhodospira sp. 9622 TaxID=2899136 RepID=UPI001EE78246|nr:dialkylrecorsinol condensing enzyme [Halorhodospira sp. 9622]MCG5537215.1 dialkylresorcinol condensing enzyme [Halorhodospira sp. 9622]
MTLKEQMKTAQSRVLVVCYSQTGQLDGVLAKLVEPLEADPAIEVEWLRLNPREPYPFPWPFFRFLEEFPEAVQLDPPELEPLNPAPKPGYDLVILGYTVWFLAPAPPVTAFLQSPEARSVLKDTPVVTVTACRNMWMTAHETVGAMVREVGGRHCDHAAFTDAGSSLASLITTPRWLLTGRKEAWLGLPPPGVSESDVGERAPRLGRALRQALLDESLDGRAAVLHGLAAVEVDEGLMMSERIGHRSFRVWSRLLRRAGPRGSRGRRAAIMVYLVFLLLMIVTVVPLSLLMRRLLRPLMGARLEALRAYHEQPSGSGRQRIGEV